MKKLFALILTALLGGTLLMTVPSPAQAAASCSTPWGSSAKTLTNTTQGTLYGVRAGRHECFDRVVLDLSRDKVGYRVRYVSAVYTQGQGVRMALRGGAFLEVVSQSMVTQRIAMPNVSGYQTLRQVGFGGSFEGYTTIGVGVRARLPFRAFTVPNKLVIDVAHRW